MGAIGQRRGAGRAELNDCRPDLGTSSTGCSRSSIPREDRGGCHDGSFNRNTALLGLAQCGKVQTDGRRHKGTGHTPRWSAQHWLLFRRGFWALPPLRTLLDSLQLATATCRPGESPDIVTGFAPDATLALYMAMHRLAQVEAELLATGAPPDCQVEIVQQAASVQERTLRTRLDRLAQDTATAGIRNPAMVLIRWPKPMAANVSKTTGTRHMASPP